MYIEVAAPLASEDAGYTARGLRCSWHIRTSEKQTRYHVDMRAHTHAFGQDVSELERGLHKHGHIDGKHFGPMSQ